MSTSTPEAIAASIARRRDGQLQRPDPDSRKRQREAALARANVRRKEITDTRRAIADGHLTFDQVMTDPPDCLKATMVIHLVELVPGITKGRIRRVATAAFHADANPCADLGDLTERQRHALRDLVADAA